MKAVIMAGGEGSRLRPLTCDMPKPLAEVCGKPVIKHITELLESCGVDEASVTLHYLPNMVKEYFEDNNLKIGIIYGNATYLLWLDVSYYTDNSFSLSKLLKTKFKVFVSEGSKYLGNGQFFIRINIATSRNILKIGLDRIRDGLLSLNQQ